MVDSESVPLGWIGAIIDKDDWEIHPINMNWAPIWSGLLFQVWF